MKFLGFLAAGLPLGVLSSGASVGFKESLLAESRDHTVSFNALPFDLPSTTLLSDKMAAHALKNREYYSDFFGPDGRITCTESGSIENKGEVAVVLAFSKCLNDTALGIVEQWVNQVKATITDIAQVTFQSTMVPGACEERSEKTKQGLEDPNMVNQGGIALLADEVHSSDLKRLEAFPSLGNVVNLADEDVTLSLNPIAVISFVTGEKSYSEVYQFELKAHISKTFNFHICKNGVNCDGTFENCIDLPEVVDLFMYNPFTVTRSLGCSNLDGGVPVTYLDDYGQRQCFCNCPAGYKLDENEYGGLTCVQVVEETCPCVWAQMNEFPFVVTDAVEECSFTNMASNYGLPVPFPTDGYVADKRETLSEGYLNPRITVTVKHEQDLEYKNTEIGSFIGTGTAVPLTLAEVIASNADDFRLAPMVHGEYGSTTHDEVATWKEYQLNRDAYIDDIEFTSYGKYHLEVSAYDYFSSATCEGCLVIVDHNRPKATTDCPTSFCDTVVDPVACTGSAELTEDNLDRANGLAEQYFDFADLASNDACSVDNRCDDESFSRRDFFETDYSTRTYNQAPECFNKATVVPDLLTAGKIKTNPLTSAVDGTCDNTAAPVPPGQCTRCCKMETALKEWWTDYRCGSDYDVRSCDGDSYQTCAFQQCLVVNGDTLATVTASITEAAKAESESVLAQVEDQAYQTVTQIHRALDCTSFDVSCQFKAKLSELIDTTETLNLASIGSGEATEYVYWRYSIVSGDASWQLWKTEKHESNGEVTYENDDVLTFSNPETKITIEAWTQCGVVRRFFFYVHLHVNSPMSVCEKFNDMWYQTSVSRLPIGTGMCAYPGSDFAELTFDFHPNAGLQYSREELKMKVSKVECTGALEGRKPIDILSVTQDSPEIVTRFAVEMANKATTEASTNFEVTCTFTYTMHSGNPMTSTCTRDFSISDCKGPAFGTPDSICQYEDCAGVGEAGLYEACGGTVIKADETCTIVETGEKPCCQGCGDTEVTCTALLDLPGENTDLMRCEPSTEQDYSTEYSYHQVAVLLSEATEAHPAAVALLGATTVIAAMALLVVRRRVIASHSAQMTDDAYYPLLH